MMMNQIIQRSSILKRYQGFRSTGSTFIFAQDHRINKGSLYDSKIKQGAFFATAPQNLDITLYQYKICPFCNKVKALLDFYKIPYKTVEVNPLTKSELSFSPDYRKVPIAKIDNVVIKDSSEIIQNIVSKLEFEDEEKSKFCSEESLKWSKWSDSELAVLLFPNITKSFSESYQAFSYIKDIESFSMTQKCLNMVFGSTAMWAAQGKLKKKYNIEDERGALYDAINLFLEDLGDKPFISGDQPGIGDISIYGVLKAIEGLTVHTELLENTKINSWYFRIKNEVGKSTEIVMV